MVQAEATSDYVLQRLAATQTVLHILKQSWLQLGYASVNVSRKQAVVATEGVVATRSCCVEFRSWCGLHTEVVVLQTEVVQCCRQKVVCCTRTVLCVAESAGVLHTEIVVCCR